jgi:hypothetical protein
MTNIAVTINDTDTVRVGDDNEVMYWAPGRRWVEVVTLREINGDTAVIERPMLGAPSEVEEVSIFRLSGSF